MTNVDRIRWGMIGCGDVTEVKSAPAFNKVDDSELLAVTSRTFERAKDYAERHAVPRCYKTVDEMLNDADVNAVYVATPPSSHAEYTIRAAESGRPVYVEKPMAMNRAEAQTMIDACGKAGVPLFVAYYRRALPKFLEVKKLLESNAIGAARLVTTVLCRPPEPADFNKDNPPWRVIPEVAGGGYFVDLAPHQLDLFDFLFGPIVEVEGHASNQAGLYPAEDLVDTRFVFENGAVGTGAWCFTASKGCEIEQTEIYGETGKITFSTFGPGPVCLQNESGTKEFEIPTPRNIQRPLIRSVVDALLGRGTCPSTGESAARTDWVIDRILGRSPSD